MLFEVFDKTWRVWVALPRQICAQHSITASSSAAPAAAGPAAAAAAAAELAKMGTPCL
jgi:hypothetical protein